MKPYKKTILIDLDGVLNTYTGGYDENFIPPIREGAYDFIKIYLKDTKLYYSRAETCLLPQNGCLKMV